MTRVKICGVTNTDDLAAAVDAGVDAVGFIVDVPVDSPREIERSEAAELVEAVPPFVTSVLVTMPTSVQQVVALQERVGADALQVHESLSPRHLAGLRARVDATVVAAVDAGRSDAIEYADAADALLVDSTDPDGGGGTGSTLDWTHTRELVDSIEVPVILAGGLTPENVGAAVETVRPYAVDTATGVERTGGTKDHDAVRRFVRNATRSEVSV